MSYTPDYCDWPMIEGTLLDRDVHREYPIVWVSPKGRRVDGIITSFTAGGIVYVRFAGIKNVVAVEPAHLRWTRI